MHLHWVNLVGGWEPFGPLLGVLQSETAWSDEALLTSLTDISSQTWRGRCHSLWLSQFRKKALWQGCLRKFSTWSPHDKMRCNNAVFLFRQPCFQPGWISGKGEGERPQPSDCRSWGGVSSFGPRGWRHGTKGEGAGPSPTSLAFLPPFFLSFVLYKYQGIVKLLVSSSCALVWFDLSWFFSKLKER